MMGNKIHLIINSSKVSYFTLAAYFDTSTLKYFCFTVVMSLYLLILCANVLLIVVICVNRSLHEPMYMFLCSLFVNELYGSTGLFPFLLLQILSDVHTVSAPLCFLQIFCVFSYVCVEFCILAVMSYDRYLAICCPLQYHTRMTPATVVLLIALSWLYSFLTILALILLIAPLELCGNVINKVYCLNYSIVKLACSETTANNIYGLFITALTVFVPVILILCSYVRILKVCFSGSKQTRQKAVSTCTPHLASLLNFSFGVCFEVIQSRFSLSSVHSMVHIVLSLYFLTCQPLFNPVLYGLNMSNIRKRLFLCGNIINKVYCDNYAIVKLACSDTTLNNIYGLISTAFTVFVPVTLIFFTYMRILKVCFSGSKQTRQKAVSTCTPHLASLLNFSCSGCFEILQSRFNMNNLPNVLRILISLYWLMCQPLFNPVLYGLKMSKIRDICKCLLYSKVNTILS
uniref:G-protein coupled receptors family 1 profile domain-containing protein n=1 Tax=Haplochromis burtoni TaxID=8153 RepID=A0A3Q3CCX4_HAPBU